jgi:hypothetical protein
LWPILLQKSPMKASLFDHLVGAGDPIAEGVADDPKEYFGF